MILRVSANSDALGAVVVLWFEGFLRNLAVLFRKLFCVLRCPVDYDLGNRMLGYREVTLMKCASSIAVS